MIYWITIPTWQAWVVVPLEDRKLVILIIFDARENTSLRVAGYHMGKVKWVGEKQDKLAIMVERIPTQIQDELVPKIRNALARELRDLEITFVDERYLSTRINS